MDIHEFNEEQKRGDPGMMAIIPPDPILLETHMTVVCVKWNHTGSLLAFGGAQKFQDGKELCCVQFYSTFGQVCCCL